MPAAAISGVMLTPVSILGSAPCASSRRITSTSADLRREEKRGRADQPPAIPRAGPSGSMSVFRPLTSAPCASSDLMTRSLSSFTAMNWSLMCQLATCTAACSGLPKILFRPFPPSVVDVSKLLVSWRCLELHRPARARPAPSARSIRLPHSDRRPCRAAGPRDPRGR